MSVLAFPRLHLRGMMSWDPIVSNNDPASYDGLAARAAWRRARPCRDSASG